MSAPSSPVRSWRPLGIIAVGVLAIAVLTPLTQLLTFLTVHDVIETATPVGWAVGMIFSLTLALVLLRRLGITGLLSKPSLVLLYAMLTIAVPLMNLGLVRPFYLSLLAVYREHLDEGNNTYRTAYAALDDDWSPKIPTAEGMAVLQVDRLLILLQDRAAQRASSAALQSATVALNQETPWRPTPEEVAALHADAVEALLAQNPEALAPTTAAGRVLRERQQQAALASAAALNFIPRALEDLGEPEASFLPSSIASLAEPQRRRLAEMRARWTPEFEAAFARRVARLAERENELRQAITALAANDRLRLRTQLREATRAQLVALEPARFHAARADFVLRLSRNERQTLLSLEEPGGVNNNLRPFRYGLWDDPTERQMRDQRPFHENLAELVARVPWQLFLGPLLRWAALFTAIFLFLMCLAEWLRRKWVERENLAFPLVDFADHLIRHDFRLELSADVQAPEPRKRAFYPLFWVGFAVGFGVLLLEVLGHYGWTPQRLAPVLNLNEAVFDRLGGAFRGMPPTLFALSPVVIGIAYLLSLQLSLSIWSTFFLYTGIVWGVRVSYPDLRDSNYTGFEGGKLFPFGMEQLVGAAAVLTGFLLWQAWRAPAAAAPATAAPPGGSFVAPWPTRLGLALLPPLILWMLWDLGVQHLPLLLLFSAFLFVQTIAVTRARAETGLPPIPSFFEMTKLPMIFGLTGSTGAKVFTSFVQVVFLPATMLFRTLPQQLENIELARRHRLPYRWMALGSLAAFATALGVGLISFLLLAYAFGGDFYAERQLPPFNGTTGSTRVATAPLWVSHFLGEPGLAQFTKLNGLRMVFIGIGAAVIGLLIFARQRFLRFPLHPLGYLITLLGIYYSWATPYVRGEGVATESSALWGSVLLAWLIKTLVVKYGGMHTYKRSKPLFVGLIAGAVICIFLANLMHLAVRLITGGAAQGSAFAQAILERSAFSPLIY